MTKTEGRGWDQGRPAEQMLARPPYPSGLPLTDSMELTGRDGVRWLVYIDAMPLPRRRRPRHSGFPGRRLRFDSAAESRVVTPIPAGSPFLTDARLQHLLDSSDRLGAIVAPTAASVGHDRRESAGRSSQRAASVLITVGRHWRQLGAGAVERLIVWVAQAVGGRPRAGW